MIHIIEYKNIISNNINDYISETLSKSDNDCYIYFYIGNIDLIKNFDFIKYIENTFKIQLNVFDISNFYNEIKSKQNIFKLLVFEEKDINNAILAIKKMYLNSIIKYINK